jgi:hypothetical protein
MVMARELYTLLTPHPFCLPTNPGPSATYVRPINPNNPRVVPDPAVPLSRTEQATIDTTFARRKHYYMLMVNIKHACFTAVDECINNAYKVSKDPTIQGWHTDMSVVSILDQLSNLFGQPTPAVLEGNNTRFQSPYLAADPPEILFCRIEECAEIALLGQDPYTNCQLVTNTIRFLLTTGLYLWPFKKWERMQPQAQTWIALCTLIQELFQRHLNATAPTAGHHMYAPALPHQQNAFGALPNNADSDDDSVETITTQVAALTYQSQLTASTADNSSQRQEIQLAYLASQQNMMHKNTHQLIEGLNAVAFNISNKGLRVGCFSGQSPYGSGYGGRSHGHACPGPRGRGFLSTSMYGKFPSLGGYTGGRFPRFMPQAAPQISPAGPPQGHGLQPYCAPGMPGMPPPSMGHAPFAAPQPQQQPFSNMVKCHANWNMCYSCGFDVADGHTSMSCPAHLHKALHDTYFRCQNAQQYINLGHPCFTRNKHKTQLSNM